MVLVFDEKKYRRKKVLRGFVTFLIFLLVIEMIVSWIYFSPKSLVAFLKILGFVLGGGFVLFLLGILVVWITKKIHHFFFWLGEKI